MSPYFICPADHPGHVLHLPWWLQGSGCCLSAFGTPWILGCFTSWSLIWKRVHNTQTKGCSKAVFAPSEMTFLIIWAQRKLQLSGLIQENTRCQVFLWTRDFGVRSAQPAGEEKLNSSTWSGSHCSNPLSKAHVKLESSEREVGMTLTENFS